jgi:site-specific recombinase XerD
MSTLIDRHLQWRSAAGHTLTTRRAAARLLRHLDRHLPDGVAEANELELVDYFRHYTNRNTLGTYDSLARAFFHWAAVRQLIEFDPMVNMPAPRRPVAEPQVPDDEHVAVALRARAPYGRAILLASRLGLRCAEMAVARREDLTRGRLRVHGKGGKTRTVPVDETVARTIADEPDYLLGRETTAGALSSHQREVWDSLGLPDTFSLHGGRRWFATRLLDSGALITEVQRLLGHASLATTQVYLQVVDSRLDAAVARLPQAGAAGPADDRPDGLREV